MYLTGYMPGCSTFEPAGVNPVGCDLFSHPVRRVGATIQVEIPPGANRNYSRGHVKSAAAKSYGNNDFVI